MTTQAFPATPKPVYGVSKSSNATVRESAFGSGYSQRTVFGLNQIAHSLDSSSKYICKDWSKTLEHGSLSTITATFEQVFEPNT